MIGSVEIRTLSTSELLEIRLDHGGKHQSSQQLLRVRVKVVAVDGDHVSKLEVTTEQASGTMQIDSNRTSQTVLRGTYIVTPSDGGHPRATRPDGTAASPEDEHVLEPIVGDLIHANDLMGILVDHPLRVGQTIPLLYDLHRELEGQPVASRSSLSLISATAASATYHMDFAASSREPRWFGDVELKGRRTIVLDRAHAEVVEDKLIMYKTERRNGRSADRQVTETLRIVR